jgi:TrmH family RNA methyltransferase
MANFEKITSRDNSRLKLARKVRDSRDEGSIFVEGARLCAEAVRSALSVETCFVTERFLGERKAGAIIETLPHDAVFIVSDQLLKSIADTETPQGIVMICKAPENSTDTLEYAIGRAAVPIIVLLDEINNPSNLGSIFRTAEAAGIVGVAVSKRSADPLSPKAIRAAMGSSFRMPLWMNAEYDDVIAWARQRKMIVTATTASAKPDHISIDWEKPRLLVFGSEGHGIPKERLGGADELVKIHLRNGVESLNIAVACGVILFEALRQSGEVTGPEVPSLR